MVIGHKKLASKSLFIYPSFYDGISLSLDLLIEFLIVKIPYVKKIRKNSTIFVVKSIGKFHFNNWQKNIQSA